jgi:gas vesicle protein
MFDDDDSATWPLLAFVLGGLTGLSLAVLFAPVSGSEARGGIASGAARAREAVRRKVETTRRPGA